MTKAMELTEKQIENSILDYLALIPNCFAWKNQTTGLYDPTKKTFRKSHSKHLINGVSDILGIYQGKMIAIEVKRPSSKKRTPAQNAFINSIVEKGGIAFYATSIDDVKKGLGI